MMHGNLVNSYIIYETVIGYGKADAIADWLNSLAKMMIEYQQNTWSSF